MGKPRAIIPDTTTLSTRRCAQRQFLLRPDKLCEEAVIYCFAVAAHKYGIEVHSVTAMSNCLQYVCTDPLGERPAFERYFYSLLARCMNVIRSRWEAFWSSDGPNAVELVGASTVLDKMVYVITDPVRQHLVDRVHAWPGVSSYRHQLGDMVMRAKRPKKFFRQDGNMPLEAELRLVRPRGFEHLSEDEWRELLERRVSLVEQNMAEERERAGTRIAGRKAVLRRSPYSHPKTSPPRRNLRPKVAAATASRRIAALKRMKLFEARYRHAMERLKAGVRDVLFPHGTYQLARLGLVRCEAPPE